MIGSAAFAALPIRRESVHMHIQCIGANVRFLLAIFKDAAGNSLLLLADSRHFNRHVHYAAKLILSKPTGSGQGS